MEMISRRTSEINKTNDKFFLPEIRKLYLNA